MSRTDAPPSAPAGTAATGAGRAFAAVEAAVAGVVLAPPITVRLAVGCLAAGGHLLVEDHPGLGKTTLAKSLAAALGLGFRRLQCTADLLPADVTGAPLLLPGNAEPVFRPGPVFTNVLMADELNRASPRAQSALLEAMEERHVTVDGTTYALPQPFFVLATQNPYDAAGTTPLPHGQLDRFLVRVSIGYPSRPHMDALVAGDDPAARAAALAPVVSADDLGALLATVGATHVSTVVRGYVLDLVDALRAHGRVAVGPSPRAARALVQVARALAVSCGRGFVTPLDVQQAAAPVLGHRMLLHAGSLSEQDAAAGIVGEVVESLPVPLEA